MEKEGIFPEQVGKNWSLVKSFEEKWSGFFPQSHL